MREWLMLPLLYIAWGANIVDSSSSRRKPESIKKWTIQMTGFQPAKNDEYVAYTVKAPTGYIVGFEPLAHADRVHHILLYGCENPANAESFWKGSATCGAGGTHILYAWARNAPNLDLPENVGFALGDFSDIKHIVLQVHYARPFAGTLKDYSGVTLRLTDVQPANLAAVMLFVTGQPIPPGLPQFQNNISCIYDADTPIHPFAFRTHTHQMGRLVSAFYKRNSKWTMIGRRNPLWPQLFQKIDSPLEIHKGDLMAATCRFDSSDKTQPIGMGSMGSDEMCNFYMMFYWNSQDANPFTYGAVCSGRTSLSDMDDYPEEGTDLLPSQPELEHHAHQSALPFGFLEEAKVERIGDIKLGQISGLCFDPGNNLVIFHRSTRVWGIESVTFHSPKNSFDISNKLKDRTPIKDDVILVTSFKGADAKLISKHGKGLFFMPHGIYIDKDWSIYTTDVGAHTIARWKRLPNGNLERVWQLGETFQPGSDLNHFCMPTAVTRLDDRIFLADGYCNGRIVEITLDGIIKSSFGSIGKGWNQFFIPHDIQVSSTNNLVVADRENGRVKELKPDGTEVTVFKSALFNNIYSVGVSGKNIFMIPGEHRPTTFGGESLPIAVFSGREGTGLTEFSFTGESAAFVRPHVIRVCPHGEHVFVSDIGSFDAKANESLLWKFKVQKEGVNHEGDPSADGVVLTYSSAGTASTPFFLFGLFVAVIVVAGLLVKRKYVDKSSQTRFDRTGFKPLKSEATGSLEFSSEED